MQNFSLWQTEPWQKMLLKTKQSDDFVKIENIFFEKRSIGLGKYGFFAIGVDKQIFEKCDTQKIISEAQKNNVLFVQVETIDYQKNKIKKQNWQEKYHKKFIPPYTIWIDLKKSEEQILAEMKQKGRYNIRLATKKNVKVMKVEKNSENIQKFTDLIQKTSKRQNFNVNQKNYYENFLNSFSESSLYFAFHKEDLIAGAIFIKHEKTAYYYYGASSEHKKNLMAPYALQWQMIQDAKNLGCEIYDFLGVADPKNPKDSLVGVTDFKQKFFTEISLVSQSFFVETKPFSYKLFSLIKKIKSFF